MLLRIFTEPQQGASYDDLLAVALVAEESGFDAFDPMSLHFERAAAGGPPTLGPLLRREAARCRRR